MESEREEEYLETLLRQQKGDTPVTTSTLAKELKVSLPAVTDMVQKMERKGLVKYTHNKGVLLSDEGNKIAVATLRRHRLWERFLTDFLGLKWDEVHEEACRLEHCISPETEEKLASALGGAETCPHGHYIPDKQGNMKDEIGVPLPRLEAGQTVCIVSVGSEKAGMLRRIAKVGLKPQTIIRIVKKDDSGRIEVALEGKSSLLEPDLAAVLVARPVTSEEAAATEQIPLSRLGSKEFGVVKSLAVGRGMLARCLSMGFTPGSLVRMGENYQTGPVLIKVHDTDVVLGRGVAAKIMVTRKKTLC
jgi:DtxR family transcriptional regulator, Mn-dependent transcriptional regulator